MAAHTPVFDRVGFECLIQSHAEEVVGRAGTRTFPAANKTRGGRGGRRGGGGGGRGGGGGGGRGGGRGEEGGREGGRGGREGGRGGRWKGEERTRSRDTKLGFYSSVSFSIITAREKMKAA